MESRPSSTRPRPEVKLRSTRAATTRPAHRPSYGLTRKPRTTDPSTSRVSRNDPPGFYPGPVSLESRARRLTADGGTPDALTVTQLYDRVERAVRSAFPEDVWVTGEVRSMKVLTKGHCFLDLVDPAQADDPGAPMLGAKCWAGTWRSVRLSLDRLGIALEAGMVVRVRGEVGFYKARGSIDFVVRELDTEALMGRVAAERARLVRALVDEDLYDRQRRLRIPTLPLRVGLVASPGTEGFNDFLGGLEGSGLAFDVTVAPTAVQGKDAPAMVATAIAQLQNGLLDVIVVVRGGGSKADLAAFDQEVVARAVATSAIPVWTGIGHTGDQSVVDEVAHRAFITPTECGQELARVALDYWRGIEGAGALLARVAREQVLHADKGIAVHRRAMATGARIQLDRHADSLGHRARNLRTVARGQVDTHARRLVVAAEAGARATRWAMLGEEERLKSRVGRLGGLPARILEVEDLRAAQRRRLLGAYDYQRQLERGYSVTRDSSGAVLRSVVGLAPGTVLVSQLADGTIDATVTRILVNATNDKTEGST
jgi:exodeoxyribonuclease VII large subunit